MADIKKTEFKFHTEEPPPSLFYNKKKREEKVYQGKALPLFLGILIVVITTAGYIAYKDINKQLSKLQNHGDYKVKNLSSSFENSVVKLSQEQREIKNSISQQIAPVVKTISYLNSKLDKTIKDINRIKVSKIKITQLQTTISAFKKSLKKTSKIQNQLLSEIKLLKSQLNNTKIVQNYLKQQSINIVKNKINKNTLKVCINQQQKDFNKSIAALKQTLEKEIRSLKIAIDLLGKKNLTQPYKSDSIDNIRELDILE